MSKSFSFKSIPLVLLSSLPLFLVLFHDSDALDPALKPRVMALGIILFPLALIITRRKSFYAALKSRPSLFLLLFFIFEICSLVINRWSVDGLVIILKDLSLYFLFLGASSLDWNDKARHNLGFVAIISIFIILPYEAILLFIRQGFQGLDTIPLVEFSGRMAHHNLLASALVLLIPFSLFLKKGSYSWLGIIGLVLALIFIYLTKSRSAVLALLGGAAFFAFSYLIRNRLPKLSLSNRSLGLVLLVLLIPILLVQYKLVFSSTGEGKALQSKLLDTSTTEKNFTTGERLQMWDYTLSMIQDHGLLGIGPGQWRIEFPMYGSEVYRARQGNVQFQRPHNDYLWIWAEAGPFAILCYLAFLLSIGLALLRNLNYNWDRSQALMGAGFIAILIVAFFSFPRERVFHQSLFFLIAGIINSRSIVNGKKGLTKLSAMGITFLGISVFALLALAGFQAWQGERISRKMIVARSMSNWSALIDLKRQTEALYFYQLSPVGMPMEFYSGLAYLNQSKLDLALREYRIAKQLHPNNLQVTNNLANTFTLMNEIDSALVYYCHAIEISPFYKEGILNLASIYFNNAQSEEAYSTLVEKAAEFDDDRSLYEQYVLTVLKAWLPTEGIVIDGFSDEQLIKWHYILAYDYPGREAVEFYNSTAVTK